MSVQIFHPQAHVVEPDVVVKALREGTAAGTVVQIRGVDGSSYRVVRRDVLRDPNEKLVPAELDLALPNDGGDGDSDEGSQRCRC